MSAIRALRQLTSTSSRRALTVSRTGPLSSLCAKRAFLPSMVVPATRAFSVSARKLGEGATDVVLAQKLAEELQYEKSEEGTAAFSEEPEFLKAFKAQGVWEVEDVSGSDEVTLSRKFGNENIRLIFSIADIQGEEDNENEFEQEENEEEESSLNTHSLRVSFSITKSSAPGSLNIDTMCQEGAFVVDNISFYKDAKLGTELTAEADWKRRGLYIGPQFDTLDVSVQEEFEKYLQERGINESLALFVPEYAEWKEQKEYVKWLENVKTFVEL